MTNPVKTQPSTARRPRGFTLIITITMMVLLTMVAVGLLTLSSITLRSSSQGEAEAVARANARLAMVIAIGELQSKLGPDARVSAPAASVLEGAGNPHLTGAWEGWRWEPAPGGSPDYSQKSGRFLGWLSSSANPTASPNLQQAASEPGASAVDLVRGYDSSNRVRAERIAVAGNTLRGGLAWATFDESTKAAIDLGHPTNARGSGEELASRFAPDRFRADILSSGSEALSNPRHLISLDTAVAQQSGMGREEIVGRFHDLTTHSIGLLTDSARGGLRQDLTQLMEANTFPTAAFDGDTPYFSVREGAPRWRYLQDHYRKYKMVNNAATGNPSYAPTAAELAPSPTGMDMSPVRERLIPVVSKVQIMFSIVSHHAHLGDRMQFYNTHGVPRGNENHAVPHLAYDPVVTLYNPYDVALDLRNLRIRIWDPPVAFRFAKVDRQTRATTWYRPEMASGEFHGLARFQIANERNPNARRFFTMVLSDGNATRAGNSLRLMPGEVKVFSPRVEPNWTWGMETAGGYNVRSFFDWNVDNNFGNVDRRTNNQFGVEAVPGWDTRAGLQTDHMSYGARPQETLYDFERNNGWGGGFVSLRLTDEVLVEARPQRTTGSAANVADFQVDVLGGRAADVTRDLVRSYRFRFGDPTTELAQDPRRPVIRRSMLVQTTMQRANDNHVAGKTPFAMLEMSARTTRDPLDDSKAWIYNNPVVEGADQTHSTVGAANQSYDVRLLEVAGWSSFPGVEIDPDTNRGYFGASLTAAEGASNVPMMRVPVTPAASLGDWVSANLIASSNLPRVVHPFGNSRAHPLIPADQVSRSLGGTTMVDHSYLLNDALWDRFYFSSVTDYSGGALTDTRSLTDVLQGVLDGTRPALNPRLAPVGSVPDPASLASELSGMDDATRARRMAAHLGIRGPFNLNSASVDAWRALLSSLRDRQITAWTNRSFENEGSTPFVRTGLPLAGSAGSFADAGADVLGQIRWAGFRTLDDSQIETLAREIVEQIRARGTADGAPSMSIAEFVNRRPGGGVHELSGLLETAIERSGINDAFHQLDSKPVRASDIREERKRGVVTPDAMDGFTGEGAPSILTQGDLMAAIAPVVTVRGDTFKIRTYGEARAATGNAVLARAWCEAVVQRVPEFLDPADEADADVEALSSEANRRFGRRFQVVSFRWLGEEEL